MNGATVSVEADCERREDRVAVARGFAVEGLVDMLEAGLERDAVTRKQRELRGAARQALERRKAMLGCELADRVHACVKVERGEARAGLADFGNALPDLRPYGRERIGCHLHLLLKAK
jgi:hypothetical protein